MSMDWKIGFDSTFSDLLSRRNVLLLLLSWFGGLAVLVAYGTVSGRFGESARVSYAGLRTPGSNETGVLAARRNKNGTGQLPAYEVTFDNLLVENGGSGCFRTASHKVVHIENLCVSFVYPAVDEHPDEEGSLQLEAFRTLFGPRDRKHGWQGSLGLLEDIQDARGEWSVSMDLTNTTEVYIRHLDWRIRHGDAAVFRVRCMHARLPAGSPCIILRGHATVTVTGATLESSCIELDVKERRLVTEGRYILTRDDGRQRGTGTCFDMQLNPLYGES